MWILDTKEGFTAQGDEVVSRAQALEQWLEKISKTSPTPFKVGLVTHKSGSWHLGKIKNGKMAYDEALEL